MTDEGRRLGLVTRLFGTGLGAKKKVSTDVDTTLAEVFPDSRAVNEALRTFARLVRSERAKTKHKLTA